MFDPLTVAFEIRYPWRKYKNPKNDFERWYRESFITIWHKDPMMDGSDNSCGWSGRRSEHYPELVKKIESDIGFLCRDAGPAALGEQRAREGKIAWWLLWLNRVSFWHRDRGLSARECARVLFSASFPGSRDDCEPRTIDEEFVWSLPRWLVFEYMRLVRPWWRHPRWHVWHWRIQVDHVLYLKRWLFSRCCRCGGRFRYGESPVMNSWDSEGPKWFRSEKNMMHGNCGGLPFPAKAAENAK